MIIIYRSVLIIFFTDYLFRSSFIIIVSKTKMIIQKFFLFFMRCAMAKNSEYNRELRAKKLDKLKELQQVLPSYVQPYLDGMRVGYQPNTLVAYARDLITFFEYLREMNPSFKDLEIKQIPLEILDELSIQDIIEYKNYLSTLQKRNTCGPKSMHLLRRPAVQYNKRAAE